MAVLGLHCCTQAFTLVMASGAAFWLQYRFLYAFAVASVVVEHRLWAVPASVVVIHGLSISCV